MSAANFIQLFGILFLIIVVVSFIVKIFKQPIIMGYVISGVLFSMYLIKHNAEYGEMIIIMAELGITFLLFLMGLEFDLKSLKYLGKDLFISSAIQSALFFGFAFGLGTLFGFTPMENVYIGLLFMFSSTLLVAKWLDDKKESTSVFGKITLGTLIIQDLYAVIALTILGVAKEGSLLKIALAPLSAIALIFLAFMLAKYALNPMLKFSSKYPELLFIFSLGVCFTFVEVAVVMQFSTTIGAFIAGITLANTIYKHEISSRLKPLIVFFNMLFFVGLGFQMNLDLQMHHIIFLGVLILSSLIIKPIIVYFSLRIRGYDIKTSFMSGIYLAQCSEFGIIIIGALLGKEHVLSAIATIVVIVSMILSSYLIKYDKQIYLFYEPFIKKIDKKVIKKELKLESSHEAYNVMFFGYNDLGKELYAKLEKLGKKVVVVENDPENIAHLKKDKVPYIYNSVNNPEFFEETNLSKVELVVSSLLNKEDNKSIIREVKKQSPNAVIIVNAKTAKESLELYHSGADHVIYQTYLHEQRVSVLLEQYTQDIHSVINQKINEIQKLKIKEKEHDELVREDNLFWDIESFLDNVTGNNKPEEDTKKDEDIPKVVPYHD